MADVPHLDQSHPLTGRDRPLIDHLLRGEPNPYNLAELARLRIRYIGFPGARDIQRDLEMILRQWRLSEEELFAQTRQIHQTHHVYRQPKDDDEETKWGSHAS